MWKTSSIRSKRRLRLIPTRRPIGLGRVPNSNTFTAFVGRQVPELGIDLPPTAVGKDYLTNGAVIGPSPSGTGYQVSLWGLVGAMAALKEGIELNLLGLVVGIDFQPFALKLPGLGRLGLK